ncbi:MAG: twin-arginine translocation signal domain-containing protein, partial [Verrucomicrobiae bacterium]|nr:twin-arginine translocation signal domain-containing protein [Verrucomicrobiae bacterium]
MVLPLNSLGEFRKVKFTWDWNFQPVSDCVGSGFPAGVTARITDLPFVSRYYPPQFNSTNFTRRDFLTRCGMGMGALALSSVI